MALTPKERSEKQYKNRKENGLCPRCGKVLDRKGHYCESCLQKTNEFQRESRRYYIKIGYCPSCRKNKIFGDERQCPECRALSGSRRKELMEEQRKRYGEKSKIYQKKLYEERSAAGICTKCGKMKAAPARKKCYGCLEKDSRVHKKLSGGIGNE